MNDFQIIREALERIEARESSDIQHPVFVKSYDSFFTSVQPVEQDMAVRLTFPVGENFDIEYYKDGEEEFEHSVSQYTNNPVDGSLGQVRIGGLTAGDWHFRRKAHQDNQTFRKPTDFRWGYWDTEELLKRGNEEPEKSLLELVSIGKTMDVDAGFNIRELTDIPLIPHVGGFDPLAKSSEDEWFRRITGKNVVLQKYVDRIEFCNLVDEPYGSWPIDGRELTKLVDYFHEKTGIPAGMTIRKKTALTKQRVIPQNAKRIGINFYMWYHDNRGLADFKMFKEEFLKTIDAVRSRYQGEIFIVGQGFGSGRTEDKYAYPNPECPWWYAEMMRITGINDIIWWRWDFRKYETNNALLELIKNQISVAKSEV